MDIYNQLYKMNHQLEQNDYWLDVLNRAFKNMKVNDLEELIEKSMEEGNDDIIYHLIDEGIYLLHFDDPEPMGWEGEDDY